MLNELDQLIKHTFSTASGETDDKGNAISVDMVRHFNTDDITVENVVYCIMYWAVIKLRSVEEHKKLTVEQLKQLNNKTVKLHDLFNVSRKRTNAVTDDDEFKRICRARGMAEDDIQALLDSMKR